MTEEDDSARAVSMQIGRNIRTLRMERGLSQEALAVKHRIASRRLNMSIKVTRIVVAATEQGDRHVKADELPGYCKVLGVPLERLMEEAVGREAMYPVGDSPMTYATLADPDRLTEFLLQRMEPRIMQMVETLTIHQVNRDAPAIVRRALKEVLGDA